MSECDRCGLEDPDCQCYMYELENRICLLEYSMEKLTGVVEAMSDFIRKENT